ncbi:MAG: BON domain-containing protein [Janthinobacterium lividum]
MENRKQQSARWGTTLTLTGVLVVGTAGCKTAATVDDPTLTSQVQQRLAADSAINREPVQVMAQAGVVTLTGAVSNNAARSLVANDAAGVAGVQEVINDLVVSAATPPVSATVTTPLPQIQPLPVPAPRKQVTPRNEYVAPVTRPSTTQTPVYPQPSYRPPVAQTAPQAPAVRVVTLPAGSTLPVRITQTLDSATTQPGDTFSGALAADILVDGMVALPRGTAVNGRVAEVHEAAHFKGSSLLSIELIGVSARGERIALSTQPYSVEGKGRGKNTAVKTGVGAAAGAVLGGIFGGGKGAAIGAAAGGGTGAAINGVTRGDQVQIPSESVVRFVTADSIAVRTSERAGASQGEPSLQTRP